MKINLAKIISIILNPVIMTPLGMLILFNSGTYLDFLSFQQKRAIFLILLTGTTIIPVSLIPVMIMHKIVSNLKMEESRERVMPLTVTLIFYVFTWYMLARINVPALISVYTITASIAVLICALVSLKWKISLHMTASGAIAGMLLAIAFRFNINLQLYLALVFLVGGLVGWARLKLNAHTPAQVYVGYGWGLALAFFMMYSF